MTLYETMFKRRSVRKYEQELLDDKTLAGIMAYLAAVEQIPGQKATFRLISQEEMGSSLSPHYIIASCEDSNEAYANVGYTLEKVDLYLQSNGLGSLWIGSKLPKDEQPGDCIVMAFGKTQVPLREKDDFNRLALSKVANVENNITEAARFAPSAVNSQPWELEYGENSVVIRYHGRGLLKARLEKRMNKIDIGIVTRFVTEALEQDGKTVESIVPKTDGKAFEVTVQYK